MNRNEQEIQRRLAIRMGVIERAADAELDAEELARKIVDAVIVALIVSGARSA